MNDRWITRSQKTNNWIGQTEKNRGTDLCHLVLRDKGCLYPDISSVTWEWSPGSGLGWVKDSAIKCRGMDELPKPPAALLLEGQGSLSSTGSALKSLGHYLLSDLEINGHPSWQQCDAFEWQCHLPSDNPVIETQLASPTRNAPRRFPRLPRDPRPILLDPSTSSVAEFTARKATIGRRSPRSSDRLHRRGARAASRKPSSASRKRWRTSSSARRRRRRAAAEKAERQAAAKAEKSEAEGGTPGGARGGAA